MKKAAGRNPQSKEMLKFTGNLFFAEPQYLRYSWFHRVRLKSVTTHSKPTLQDWDTFTLFYQTLHYFCKVIAISCSYVVISQSICHADIALVPGSVLINKSAVAWGQGYCMLTQLGLCTGILLWWQCKINGCYRHHNIVQAGTISITSLTWSLLMY